MSNGTAGRTAFTGLRPTIIWEPQRSKVPLEAEARLLDQPELSRNAISVEPAKEIVQPQQPLPTQQENDTTHYATAGLLKKKRRDVLIPVTFRMPQSLKLRLEQTAKARELNQTDLINEAIELNLSRYK